MSSDEDDIVDDKPTASTELDVDQSVDLLYQSFITWHRLQRDGIVKCAKINSLRHIEDWHDKYPNTFTILHNGSKCKDSMKIGEGKYAKVYQRGALAYKIVRVGTSATKQRLSATKLRLSNLKCNIKELCFFHSMNNLNVMKCTRSQMIMKHGVFRKIIHEMHKARYTLQEMIYTHEITCYRDLVHIISGIAKGMRYMHTYDIVHGDIKPANILITSQYDTYISDFTLTTFPKKGDEIAFGTLFWRSPECLLGKACGSGADVWSLGVMLLDCVYGCNYMKDIVDWRDDHDAIKKLIQLIGQPPIQWIEANLTDETKEILFTHDEQLEMRIAESTVQITLTDDELKLAMDLVDRIMRWNPEDRPSIDEVLKHPFFGGYVETSKKVSTINREKVWHIHWRDQAEKQHVENWVKFSYHDIFGVRIPHTDDWFLVDCVVLSKRIIDRLKIIEATFNVKNIIKMCVEFLGFIWKNYWPTNDDVLFECKLYHILNLLKFDVFAFNVEHIFMNEQQQAKEIATTKSSSVSTTETVQFSFGNGIVVKI
jgi:serine/threonine protein kinase